MEAGTDNFLNLISSFLSMNTSPAKFPRRSDKQTQLKDNLIGGDY